jgi:hypothetical protein
METSDLIKQATAKAKELFKSGDDGDRRKGIELVVNLACLASRDMDMITIIAVARATEQFNKGGTDVKRIVKDSIDFAIRQARLSITKGDRKIVTKSMVAAFRGKV